LGQPEILEPLLLRESIKAFLLEDIGCGDITSAALFHNDQIGKAEFIAKEPLMAAGLASVAAQVFLTVNPEISWRAPVSDGQQVAAGEVILEIEGPVLDLLKAERVALNLTQRLSGIADLTAEFVAEVADLPVRLVDTRKTTPGLRLLEKYAVRVGGGHNHRFSMSDGILIKDNHIAATGSIRQAVDKIREVAPHTLKIEVEVETIAQVEECLACRVDAVLLDNMACHVMRQAVDMAAGRALMEASGGVNLANVREIAETGVDIISIGALTHSAAAADISMRFCVSAP
jgi:nicotinate-nucleotide pyrophosphorylase (carboxylating)